MSRHLLTLYTRSPLHVGSGTSVDVVDLPIMRERITGFPVIPATSLKGVLLQQAREKWGNPRQAEVPPDAKALFGTAEPGPAGGPPVQVGNAGCVQIGEAKLLAFPVRSLAGCFAWITSPVLLERFQRDTGHRFEIPRPNPDRAAVTGSAVLAVPGQNRIVLEEFALTTLPGEAGKAASVATALGPLCTDPIWTGSLASRLAVLNDENLQYFATNATEIVTRIKIDPAKRTVDGGALFNQENIPCETLFYSVLHVLPPRRSGLPPTFDPAERLSDLLPSQNPPILQIGGDETTGHGLCATLLHRLQ